MSIKLDPAAVLDLSRAPRGELVAAQLVAAVAEVGDLAERHYLELKGPPDLGTKVNKQKAAKFILGAANRMPSRAAEAFEGYGVMIIGITKNGIEGVPPVEMLSLSQVIQPILGAKGPRWDIVRLPVENSANQVVVFLVDPPEMGQPPFLCRASGEGLQDGRIYYRADGETREPTSDELDQIMARGAAKPQDPVDLAVSVVGEVLPVVVDNERTIEEFVERIRTRLLSAIPEPEPKAEPIAPPTGGAPRVGLQSGLTEAMEGARSSVASGGWLASSAGAGKGLVELLNSDVPEKRTEPEYRAEIESWESDFRAAWPDAVNRYLAYAADCNEIRIVNNTKTFLHDVVVDIHLEGAIEAIDYEYARDDGPDWNDLRLPKPPRKWGPTKRKPSYGLGIEPVWMPPASMYTAQRPYTPPSAAWTNGGSVDVRVEVGDLRPEGTFESDDTEAILVIRGVIPAQVRGTWKATARGYNEVFTGVVEARMADSTRLTEGLRRFLAL